MTRKTGGGGREAQMDEKHKDISLHHLIRHPSNPYHEGLKKYDQVFKSQGYKASLSDVTDYKRTVSSAEVSSNVLVSEECMDIINSGLETIFRKLE